MRPAQNKNLQVHFCMLRPWRRTPYNTKVFSPPSWCPSSLGSHKVLPSFLQLPCRWRTLHWMDEEAGLESLWCRYMVPKHHHSHSLHFPGAQAVLLRGTGSLDTQLSLCVSMPCKAYMVVCSIWDGRHCKYKLLGRHLNHIESSLDMHDLSGSVLIKYLASNKVEKFKMPYLLWKNTSLLTSSYIHSAFPPILLSWATLTVHQQRNRSVREELLETKLQHLTPSCNLRRVWSSVSPLELPPLCPMQELQIPTLRHEGELAREVS